MVAVNVFSGFAPSPRVRPFTGWVCVDAAALGRLLEAYGAMLKEEQEAISRLLQDLGHNDAETAQKWARYAAKLPDYRAVRADARECAA